MRELRGGTATFGTWGTARYYPGVDFVAEFRRRHPSVRVRVVGPNSSEVVEAVRAGELEAGMVSLPIDDRGLDVQPIMRDEILYASTDADARAHVRPRSRRWRTGRSSWPTRATATEDPTRRQLAELAQRVGVSIQPQIDVEDIEAALELAARGLGDTIVSRGILLAMGRRVSKRLGWVPFDEPFYATFAFVSRANAPLSPASREFLGLAREGAGRAGPQAAHRPAAPADARLSVTRVGARRCRRAGGAGGRRRPWR